MVHLLSGARTSPAPQAGTPPGCPDSIRRATELRLFQPNTIGAIMEIRTIPLTLTKRYPLTISRGTAAGSENLVVEVKHDGVTGLGEMAPVSIGDGAEDAAAAGADLARWAEALHGVTPWEMQRVEAIVGEQG